jgi:hypothetical protein
VTIWPRAPLEIYAVACIGRGVETAGRGVLVAVYIGGLGGGGLHETRVLVERIPAGGLRARCRGVVELHRVGAVLERKKVQLVEGLD